MVPTVCADRDSLTAGMVFWGEGLAKSNINLPNSRLLVGGTTLDIGPRDFAGGAVSRTVLRRPCICDERVVTVMISTPEKANK